MVDMEPEGAAEADEVAAAEDVLGLLVVLLEVTNVVLGGGLTAVVVDAFVVLRKLLDMSRHRYWQVMLTSVPVALS